MIAHAKKQGKAPDQNTINNKSSINIKAQQAAQTNSKKAHNLRVQHRRKPGQR